MKIDDWLRAATEQLTGAGIETARLDALVLLEDCLGRDRAALLAHPELELRGEHISVLSVQLRRRGRHEPLAFIRGQTEFYGRVFKIDNNVLEPRPETETMVELLRTLPVGSGTTIIDVGTGSGALAITAKLEYPAASVIAVDIDPNCLEVCRANTKRLGVDIRLLESDLLAGVNDIELGDCVLLCNLPYVPDDFHINLAARHEPALAIFGGPDGLDAYRKLFGQLDGFQNKPHHILTESLPPSHPALEVIAKQHGYKLTGADDFIQVFTSRLD